MKTIQVTMDEDLLAEFDAAEEVRRIGRSAVLRRAVAKYLAEHRRREITGRYRQAYGTAGETGLGPEFRGWEDEGTWPDD